MISFEQDFELYLDQLRKSNRRELVQFWGYKNVKEREVVSKLYFAWLDTCVIVQLSPETNDPTDWINENINYLWSHQYNFVTQGWYYYFENADDAMLFKLRWG